MYKRGQSGNPKGRPKGARNKVGAELRAMISEFLFNEFPSLVVNYKKLKPREQARVYTDLLQYGLPKLQAVSVEAQLEQLTDDQLNELMNRLTKYANEEE